MTAKPRLAMYWAAACGGCDIAVLNIHEKILDVANAFDIVFWPCAMDAKYADVEALPDSASPDVLTVKGMVEKPSIAEAPSRTTTVPRDNTTSLPPCTCRPS